MFSKDKLFFLYLNNTKKMQPKKFNKLYFQYENYGNFRDCIDEIKFSDESVKEEIISSEWEKKIRPIIEYMDSKNIRCMFYGDEDYPEDLINLDNPPALLYYIGDVSLLKEKCLSVIGSRIATSYGYQVTEQLIPKISENNVVIVSGMAEGIDGYAQSIAIKHGKTVAVLGGGVDYIYPLTNKDLYGEIIKGGLVLSEYPLSSRPFPGNFPERNRIIAAISKCVLVIEAGKKSGTMSTVEYAMELGKTVCAVPGSILSSSCEGTNQIIKDGCQIVLSASDVLEEYGIFKKEKKKVISTDFSGLDKQIIQLLEREDMNLYEMMNILKVDYGTISQNLVMLEIAGAIEACAGNIYTLKR